MARLPRYVVPGQPQHVIQRGNNRAPILSEVRDTLQKGWVLGDERFKNEIAALSNRRTQRLPKGRPVPEKRSRRPRNGSTML